jgi:hypothetical protein
VSKQELRKKLRSLKSRVYRDYESTIAKHCPDASLRELLEKAAAESLNELRHRLDELIGEDDASGGNGHA